MQINGSDYSQNVWAETKGALNHVLIRYELFPLKLYPIISSIVTSDPIHTIIRKSVTPTHSKTLFTGSSSLVPWTQSYNANF